jgi:hypothetical protein
MSFGTLGRPMFTVRMGDMAEKLCTGPWGEVKSLDKFSPDLRGRDGHVSRCRACTSARVKKWYQDNPERVKAYRDANAAKQAIYQLRSNARRKGLDPDVVMAYREVHGGLCDLCGELPAVNSGRLCIDHDHATGKFRGLLCTNCNMLLGHAKDSVKRLEQAVQYLLAQDTG